jgi:hypothetical protein
VPLLAAVIGACTAAGCGRGNPAPQAPSTGSSNTPVRVNGTEKVVWDQIANDANQLSRYRYILFVDDVPVDLAGARCGTTASASGTFPCTAPLPRMQPGPHRLQLAVEETDKEKRRSPKSGAIFLDVAAPKIP